MNKKILFIFAFIFVAGAVYAASDSFDINWIIPDIDYPRFIQRWVNVVTGEDVATMNSSGELWLKGGIEVGGDIDMNGNNIVDVNNIVATGNITTGGLFSGQPIDGGIGTGLISSNNLTSSYNLFIGHNHTASPEQITYGQGYYRGINPTTGNAFYCEIAENTVTPPQNTTSIYYIDEDCTVQRTTWNDFGGSIKLFYPWFLALMKHETDIEFHYTTTLMNHLVSKDDNIYFTFESLQIAEGFGLTTETFTNLTIGSGSYQFVRDIAETSEQNTTDGAEVEVIAYASGDPVIVGKDGGLNLEDCDDGSDIVTCTPSSLYRRTLIGMVGQVINGDDTSEIHQLLPLQSETFSNIANCQNIVDSPLADSFTLPSYYQGVFINLYVYCYKPSSSSWDGVFIDIRDTSGLGGGGSIDTSAFLQKAGDTWTGNEDGGYGNTTNWNYGLFDFVGIGTAAPQNKLNVIGDGNFTDDLFIGGNINAIGNLYVENITSTTISWGGGYITSNTTCSYLRYNSTGYLKESECP